MLGVKLCRSQSLHNSVLLPPQQAPLRKTPRNRRPGSVERPPTFLRKISESQNAPSQEALGRLYAARCEDLRISASAGQKLRFVNLCVASLTNRKFVLQDAGLGKCSAEVLGQLMSYCVGIAQLDIGQNLLGDEGAQRLLRRLANSQSLMHLSLASNNLSVEGTGAVFDSVTSHQSIVSLDLSSGEGLHKNKVCASGALRLRNLLKQTQILTHLNIAGTTLGSAGLAYLAEGLKSNKSLIVLNLANNNLTSKLGLFCESVAHSALQELNLSANRLGNGGAEHLGKMLSGTFKATLIKLDLTKTSLSSPGLASILTGLSQNARLVSLTLACNCFAGGVPENLNSLLSLNKGLRSLDLSSCELPLSAFQHIAVALGTSPALQVLNLANNQMTDPALTWLADSLQVNTRLQELNLSRNRLSVRPS